MNETELTAFVCFVIVLFFGCYTVHLVTNENRWVSYLNDHRTTFQKEVELFGPYETCG